ncbi:MAG: septum formation initiator family protein [Deltaproteobacteria bacterium]|nr:septum formation initiator family protein [Deltaproteobacteria bacterium]
MRIKFQKYRIIINTGLLLCLALVIWVYFAPYGAKNYLSLRQELTNVSSEVDNLRQQNLALRAEINEIKHDPNYLKKIARQNYNLLKKNEMIFDFSKKKKRK